MCDETERYAHILSRYRRKVKSPKERRIQNLKMERHRLEKRLKAFKPQSRKADRLQDQITEIEEEIGMLQSGECF